jgi:hypothetical protein
LQTTLRIIVSLIACGALCVATAAWPVLGVARGMGDFRIDQATVSQSGTLFDGSLVETDNTRSELMLKSGSKLTLTGSSRAKVYDDRMVLETGGAELSQSGGYEIEARSLHISASEDAARVQVALESGPRVRVAAINGEVQVRNAKGVLVARITPGMALALNSAVSEDEAMRMSGVVRRDGQALLLTDEVTNVTAELRGIQLAKAVGSRVEITGSILDSEETSEEAEHVVDVDGVEELDDEEPASDKPTGSDPTAPAGKTAGIGGTKIAVIGGIAAAGATAGILYTTVGGDDEAPLSR